MNSVKKYTPSNITTTKEISYHIGATMLNENVKIIKISEDLSNATFKYKTPEPYTDTFDIRFDNKTLIVKRTDVQGGWGQDLYIHAKYVVSKKNELEQQKIPRMI